MYPQLHVTLLDVLDLVEASKEPEIEVEVPCLPAQVSLLAREPPLTSPTILRIDLPPEITRSFESLQSAWSVLANNNHILRTVLIKTKDEDGRATYKQRVLKTPRNLFLGVFNDLKASQSLQGPALMILEWTSASSAVYFCIHPALADQTSLTLLWRDFLVPLYGGPKAGRLPWPDYTSLVLKRDAGRATDFWQDGFQDATPLTIHSIPSERTHTYRITHPSGHGTLDGTALTKLATRLRVLQSSIFYAALGIVLQRHSQGEGSTAAFLAKDRDRTIEGCDAVIGFADHVFPIKTCWEWDDTTSQAIQRIAAFAVEASSFACLGHDAIKSAQQAAPLDFSLVLARPGTFPEAVEAISAITFVVHVDSEVSAFVRHDIAIPEGKVKVLLDHFLAALAYVVYHPDSQLRDVDITSEDEKQFILSMGRPLTEPLYDNVHTVFERQVERTPHAEAITFLNSDSLSYDQLNRIANRVARHLPSRQRSFVPVCVQRSLNMIISLLAILKTGAAYVILDPETPKERNQFIVQDVDASFVIVDRTTCGRYRNEVVIEDIISSSQLADDTNLLRPCNPNDPVYVIYTSGSTGKPKGVLHAHSSATSGLAAFPTLPNLRQLLFHNPVFSAAQRSIWSTLKQGGCLCLAGKDDLTVHIGRTINMMRVNVIDVTPSTALLLRPGTVPYLRRMTVAGELINPALIPEWANELELLNAYGLSENTQVNWRREMTLGQNPQNIGRPSDTTTSYVLVPGTTQLSPLLVPGELCLGGHQLAVHYINRPDKTAEAFITNPFGPGRLYRTGDMVVAHEDGSIEMVGRIDFQIKINGQRVEPGDSNTIIQTHKHVHNSSVVSATIEERTVLVAVVMLKPGSEWSSTRTELVDLLRHHIPGYIMPTYWLPAQDLPLNVNGKVDIPRLKKHVESIGRQKLLMHSNSVGHVNGAVDGHNKELLDSPAAPEAMEIEEPGVSGVIRRIWAEVLSLPVSSISSKDSFQGLGGSSLDAIRVSSLAHHKKIAISVPDVLQLPLKDLWIKAQGSYDTLLPDTAPQPFSLLPANTRIDLDNVEDAYPTTALQESFLANTLSGRSDYIYRRYYRVRSHNMDDVRRGLQRLATQSTLLRTTFVQHKTSFLLIVRKKAEISWHNYDMTSNEFSSLPKREMHLGGNFVHFTGLSDSIIAVAMHHALYDYWSNKFLVDDLADLLEGHALTPRPSFASFIQHTQSQMGVEAREFWKENLRDAVPCTLGWKSEKQVAVFQTLTDDFKSFVSTQQVSLGSILYTAWSIVLSAHTGKDDVIFGTTLSGRDLPVPGILEIPGPTIATVPCRVRVDPDSSLIQLARDVQERMWAVNQWAQLGLRRILRETAHDSGLFDTAVNIQVQIQDDATEAKSRRTVFENHHPFEPNFVEYTNFELQYVPEGLQLSLLSRIPEQKAAFLLGNVAQVLRKILQQPDLSVSSIHPITSREEVDFMDSLSSPQPTQSDMLGHSMLEKMATKVPGKIALRDDSNAELSFGELDAAANHMARYLRARGVQTEDVIPICMKKSVNVIVAIFGILKSGAAFTPLDPKNAPARNEFILKEAQAKTVIVDTANLDLFQGFNGAVINMDKLATYVLKCPPCQRLAVPDLGPDNLAYVLFTSGSTGTPKGAQIKHGSLAASAEGQIEACHVDSEWNVLWFLNYIFDAAYWDVFIVLGAGGMLSIAEQDTMVNDLAGCINRFGVRQLMITPTISKLIAPDTVPTLKTLLVCGEPITSSVVKQWATSIDVYNAYGPTETTINVSIAKVLPTGHLRSIGHPLKAVKAWILHPDTLAHVPYGAVGELCVTGAHVFRGYLNRPDLTAASLVTREDGTVLYKTGDYARWLPDGQLECLGRKDSQIKLNGYRIELGEIENAILSQASDLVRSCVVGMAHVQQKPQIVVYYIPHSISAVTERNILLCPRAEVDPSLIMDRLTLLAHYMMPRLFLPFVTLPLLPSGKVNRNKLKMVAEGLSHEEVVAYSSLKVSSAKHLETGDLSIEERLMRQAWADLFDVPHNTVQLSDHFHTYGGDSIAAINLVSLLRKQGYSILVDDIVSNPILYEQAKRLRPGQELRSMTQSLQYTVSEGVYTRLRDAGLNLSALEDIYPCGPGQIEFLTQGHSESQFWQLLTVRRLPKGFDLNLWIELTTKLTQENQILRAMFLKQDDSDDLSWIQVILKEPILDLSIVTCQAEQEKTALVQRLWDSRFELGKPFVRYVVLCYPDGTRDMCIKLDHAMYDGTLLRIFDDQFARLRDGQSLPQVVPFKAFVDYSQHSDRTPMEHFWTSLLADHTFSYPGHIADPHVESTVFAHTYVKADSRAKSAGVTVSIVFQAAYTILLSILSGCRDVSYDYLLTGRNVAIDNPQLINGTCANFLPFRSHLVDSNETLTTHKLLKDTQSLFWKVTENGLVSLGEVYRLLKRNRADAACKTLFLFQPFEPAVGEQNHMRWNVLAMSKVMTAVNYAIMFEVFKDVEGHKLKMQYDKRVFSPERAKTVVHLYTQIVQALVERGNIPVEAIQEEAKAGFSTLED